MSAILNEFIRDAARAGKSRAETKAALQQAGWADEEINETFKQFAEVDFPVPVPRPSANVSARYLALNLFFFLVLLLVICGAGSIVFTLLDYYLPDGQGKMQGVFYSSYQSLGESLRTYLAMVVVCAPLLIFTARKISVINRNYTQGVPLIRLRLIYLTYLVAGVVLLIDFIMFAYYFLSGELSIRFVIKVAVCTGFAAAVYYYFKPEAGSAEKKA